MLSCTSTGPSLSNMILFPLKQFLLTHITLTFWLVNFNHTVLTHHPTSLRPPQTPSSPTPNLGDSRHTIVLTLPFFTILPRLLEGKNSENPLWYIPKYLQTWVVFFARNNHLCRSASPAVAFRQTSGRALNASSMYIFTNRQMKPKTL